MEQKFVIQNLATKEYYYGENLFTPNISDYENNKDNIFILIIVFPIILDIVLILLSIIPIMWLSDFDCSILRYYEEIPKNLLTIKLFNKLFI